MNKQQLASKIWESANKMRSKIEANEYKDYILGFIFYKFLSETEVARLKARDFAEEDLPSLVEDDEETVEFVKGECGYFIAYENLFSTWVAKGGDFEISNVRDALSAFSRNIDPARKRVFDGIFDTLQTGLSKLGTDARSQSKAARDLIYLIKDIPMDGRQDYDVLGFIYEYLISNFAANAGKKAGEFYTPHEVSMLMSEIVSWHLAGRENITIYDPTSGSGSLLINIGKAVARRNGDPNSIKYYAQELKENTYNLTRMNLVMRGILPDNIVARNGDTLEDDWPWFDTVENKDETYNPLFVDAVVSNPPTPKTGIRKTKNSIRASSSALLPNPKPTMPSSCMICTTCAPTALCASFCPMACCSAAARRAPSARTWWRTAIFRQLSGFPPTFSSAPASRPSSWYSASSARAAMCWSWTRRSTL